MLERYRLLVALWCLPLLTIALSSNAQTLQASIACTNNLFKGEILLVTNMDVPLELVCTILPPAQVPEGYKEKSSQTNWQVTSGSVSSRGNNAAWDSMQPGLQTVTASGRIVYHAPESDGWFSSQQPDLEYTFKTQLQCLVPVKVESLRDGKINGFEVGVYPGPHDQTYLRRISPTQARRVQANAEMYQQPTLFYPVTKETFHLKVFKEYALGEFDLDPRFKNLNYPRYITIHPNMLRKLDLLKTLMNAQGEPVSKFNIIYGYRSPAYNIGAVEEDGAKTLKEPYSMHMYGLALDIIVDEDNDLVIDDLNDDGRIDIEDARTLRSYVDQLDRQLRADGSNLIGGAGTYFHHDFWERGAYVQTPYVHFDARNYQRENGTLIRWETKDTIGIRGKSNAYTPKKAIPPYPF